MSMKCTGENCPLKEAMEEMLGGVESCTAHNCPNRTVPADEMCGGCPELEKIINRLGAYEDTGLEPEEIATATQNSYTTDQIEALQGEAYDLGADSVLRNRFDIPWDDAAFVRKNIDHLLDLAKAEQEGRLVVLPCGGYTDKDGEEALKNAMYM